MTKAVDALPADLLNQFIKLAKDKAVFWSDMFELQSMFGMRNSEVRELRADCVDLDACTIALHDSKQSRSYITKKSNSLVNDAWMVAGRRFLRERIPDQHAAILVRLATDARQLKILSCEYQLEAEYDEAYQNFYDSMIDDARSEAAKTAPRGRVIDFSRYPKAKAIIVKRMREYGSCGGFLFQAKELDSNRAKSQGSNPVSRQSVFRIIKSLRLQLENLGTSIKKKLTGVRTGLHSLRKYALQKVAAAEDLFTASIWVGHGNGKGDIATTQRYLNKSEQRMQEVYERLSRLQI